MTDSLAEALAGLPPSLVIELGAGDLAWIHELRDPRTGEWVNGLPPARPGTGIHRYSVPDPKRLIASRGPYRSPADQPFFKAHPVSPANIIAAYDATDPGTREQGRRWYADVHLLAGKIAGGDAEKGGILLSTYSPQTPWPVDALNAARSYERGRAIGPADGMAVTRDRQAKAQKALDGEGIDELMTTAKTHSFGVLIKNGDDSPDDPYGHVVVDTHALNVAAGGHLRGTAMDKAPIGDARYHEYVADQYRQAAAEVSKRDGVLMKPHQLQAITWLAQQQRNQAQDAWDAEHGAAAGLDKGKLARAKGRATMVRNAWQTWMSYAKSHNLPLSPGITSLAGQILITQLIELLSEDSITAQVELGWRDAWRGEPRGRGGEWESGAAGHGGLGKVLHKAKEVLTENPGEYLASPEVTKFVSDAARNVPALLGGGHEAFNGTVRVDHGMEGTNTLAELGWDGAMNLRSDVHDALHQIATQPGEPVRQAGAAEILLHELIHGNVPDGVKYRWGAAAYQDYHTAQIEEGFTELGAIQHAGGFFDAVGIGSRKAAEEGSGGTMDQFAAEIGTPAYIRAGDAWGHYPGQTAAAYDWVSRIASSEGWMPDSPQALKRITELSDEINRQGVGGKVGTMAMQAVRAAARTGPAGWSGLILSDQDLEGIKAGIREQFSDGNGRAATGAAVAARQKLAAAAAGRAA
jgi:hypothetical protein